MIDISHWITEARWAAFVLSIMCIAWTACPAYRAVVKGDLSAEGGYNLSNLCLALAFAGFQSGFLFEGVPDEPHWRNVVNLMIGIIGFAVYSIVSLVRRVERLDQYGHKTWLSKFAGRKNDG